VIKLFDPLQAEAAGSLHLLSGLTPEQIADLISHCEFRYLVDREMLVEPGMENHSLFVLIDGRLDIHLDKDLTSAGFSVLPGECVGEMSIIDGSPTSAYVVSHGESKVLVIGEELFWNRMASAPSVVRNLLRQLTRRMRNRNEVLLRAQEEHLKYEHLQQELAAAGNLQMGMLPSHRPFFPVHRQVDVQALIHPAKEVGGDLYDAIPLNDEEILVAVGDVSGKGMSAALFMMRTLTSLRAQLALNSPVEALLANLNNLLCERNESDMFVTLCIGILNVQSGRLRLLNGGHNPPLLLRKGRVCQVLDQAKGALLGMIPNLIFRSWETTLEAGDRLLLYTDGVTEAENRAKEWFSMPRLLDTADQIDPQLGMSEFVESLAEQVKSFTNGTEQSDDITILALRFGVT
jgi:sigma-B regulation protein RsbU (phosphoserine phosphatase)